MVVGERRGIGGIGTWIGQWKRMKDRNHGWGLWIGDEMVDDDGRTELWRRKFPLPTQIRGLPQVLITESLLLGETFVTYVPPSTLLI